MMNSLLKQSIKAMKHIERGSRGEPWGVTGQHYDWNRSPSELWGQSDCKLSYWGERGKRYLEPDRIFRESSRRYFV